MQRALAALPYLGGDFNGEPLYTSASDWLDEHEISDPWERQLMRRLWRAAVATERKIAKDERG